VVPDVETPGIQCEISRARRPGTAGR